MVHPHWIWLGLFMAGVLAVALYGLTASGHFPADARSDKFKSRGGSPGAVGDARGDGARRGQHAPPSPGGSCPGISRCSAAEPCCCSRPLLLQAFPDSFVDGRRGLLVFSVCAVVLAALMRVTA